MKEHLLLEPHPFCCCLRCWDAHGPSLIWEQQVINVPCWLRSADSHITQDEKTQNTETQNEMKEESRVLVESVCGFHRGVSFVLNVSVHVNWPTHRFLFSVFCLARHRGETSPVCDGVLKYWKYYNCYILTNIFIYKRVLYCSLGRTFKASLWMSMQEYFPINAIICKLRILTNPCKNLWGTPKEPFFFK